MLNPGPHQAGVFYWGPRRPVPVPQIHRVELFSNRQNCYPRGVQGATSLGKKRSNTDNVSTTFANNLLTSCWL